MPSPLHQIQPPRRIFWILGSLSLIVGCLLLAAGLSLNQNVDWRTFGLILIGLGGVGVGIGGRMLVSCYIGLRKSQQSQSKKTA